MAVSFCTIQFLRSSVLQKSRVKSRSTGKLFLEYLLEIPKVAAATDSEQPLKVAAAPAELLHSGGQNPHCVFLLRRITAEMMFSFQILIAVPRNALGDTEYVFCGSA